MVCLVSRQVHKLVTQSYWEAAAVHKATTLPEAKHNNFLITACVCSEDVFIWNFNKLRRLHNKHYVIKCRVNFVYIVKCVWMCNTVQCVVPSDCVQCIVNVQCNSCKCNLWKGMRTIKLWVEIEKWYHNFIRNSVL